MNRFDDYTYYRILPGKRMASGTLIFDNEDRFLILKPSYKKNWEIPGGVVEMDESPMQACIREVREETGLVLRENDLKLLCLEYKKAHNIKTESLKFIFDGGILKDKDLICLNSEEVIEFRFESVDRAEGLLSPVLFKRVTQAVKAREQGSFLYTES